MDILIALKGIRKLLNSPKRWIKGVLWEKDGNGKKYCYCLLGALIEVCDSDYATYKPLSTSLAKAMNIPIVSTSWDSCVQYNNNPKLTYSGMRARLDRAIKRLEAK